MRLWLNEDMKESSSLSVFCQISWKSVQRLILPESLGLRMKVEVEGEVGRGLAM